MCIQILKLNTLWWLTAAAQDGEVIWLSRWL
jgi:hypothetical protein